MTRFGPPLVTTHSVIQTPIRTQYGKAVAVPLRNQQSIEYPEQQKMEGEEENNQNDEYFQTKYPTHPPVSVPLGRSLNEQYHTSLTSSIPRTAPAVMTSQMCVHPHENLVYSNDVVQFPVKHVSDHHNQPRKVVISKREHELMLKHLPHLSHLSAEKLLLELVQLDEITKQMARPHVNVSLDTSSQTTEKSKALAFNLEAKVQVLENELAQTKATLESFRQQEAQLKKTLEQYKSNDSTNRSSSSTSIQVLVASLCEENQSLKTQIHRIQSLEKQKFQAKAIVLKDKINGLLLDHLNEFKQKILLEIQQMYTFMMNKQLFEQIISKAQDLKACYLEEKKERQLIAEKYHEISGSIRVFCRIRPSIDKKYFDNTNQDALIVPKRNTIFLPKQQKEFQFDQVFSQQSTQTQIYEQIEPVIVSFMDGLNTCLLAYGQTGSGKTYTMVGMTIGKKKEEQGMIPRALQQVFQMCQARKMFFQDNLSISMIEIYNDQIVDLLLSNTTKFNNNTNTKNNTLSQQAIVKNEKEISKRIVKNYLQVNQILEEGNQNRSKASTKMNMDSSRSHGLVFLHLSSQNLHTMDIKKSTLCLVDLAGSERITRSQVTGKRLKETQHINKSLSALGDVIYALQHKSKHIPFRNSKLTYILREMLSGKAKTLMMLQLSPEEENVEETICSLQFGARVSQIQLGAVQRSEESGEILRLRQEKKQLEHKMYNLQEKNQELLVKQLKLQEKHEQLLQMHSKDTITHQMMTCTSSTSVATQIISEVASAPASASSSASSSAPAVIEVEDDEEDNIVMEENRLIMMQRAPIEVEEAFDEVRLIAPTDFSSTIRPKTSSPSASLLHRRRSSTSSSGASSTSSTTFSSPSANTRHVSSTSRSSTSSSTVASPMGSSAAASGSVSKRTVSPTPSRRSSLYETKRVHGTGSVVSTSTASLSASASSCRRKKEIACSAPSIVPQGFSSLSSTSGTSRIPRPKAGITKRSSMSSLEDNTRTKSSTSTVRTKRSTSTDTNSNNSRSKALWR